jgi:hypothetical protein
LKINKISSGIGALALGAFFAALPAFATNITETFSTTLSPNFGIAPGETTSYFDYVNATSASFNPVLGANFGGPIFGSPSDSFGGFIFDNAAPPNGSSSNVTVALTPTINGGQAAVVDFSGAISSVVTNTGVTQFSINFGTTAGSTQVNMGTASNPNYYTEVTSGGVNYAIQTTQTLGSSQNGKQTWLAGFIQGVPTALTPEPATLSTTGIALLLVGFGIRRKAKAKN